MDDPNLMRQIGRERSPSLRMADRILAFISEHDGERRNVRGTPETDQLAETNEEEQHHDREPEE